MKNFGPAEKKSVDSVLGAYHLGARLRELRLAKKIALTDLARHTGLSASMLSQLETGKLLPTLPTLARIAMVFDVGIEHFFERGRDRTFAIVRRDERMRFPESPEQPAPSYFFECLAFAAQDKMFDVYLAEFPARQVAEVTAHRHPGAEFIFVIENSLIVRYEGEDHALKAGDSVYFDADEPHSYRSAGPKSARALVVTSEGARSTGARPT